MQPYQGRREDILGRDSHGPLLIPMGPRPRNQNRSNDAKVTLICNVGSAPNPTTGVHVYLVVVQLGIYTAFAI